MDLERPSQDVHKINITLGNIFETQPSEVSACKTGKSKHSNKACIISFTLLEHLFL